MDIYIPLKGGLSLPDARVLRREDRPRDQQAVDRAVRPGPRRHRGIDHHGNADGTFTINNVPDGTYTLTYWDEPQDYILDLISVTS